MSVKISRLEIENVKRVQAIALEPAKDGLTVIGGKNGQGKTSILDAIAWGLGGEKYRPSEPHREGSMLDPMIHIVLDNGLVVERKGKNSDLKVTDPSGQRSGQQLLNGLVEQMALDLPRFLAQNSREKAQTLLRIIGVGDELAQLDREEETLYNRRRTIGQISDQKAKFAKEQPFYPEAPADLVSAGELIRRQQDILARNGENQRLRGMRDELGKQVDMLRDQLREVQSRLERAEEDFALAQKTAAELQDESTAELEKSIADIDEINHKVRKNLDKQKAEEDARDYARQYEGLSVEIESVRQQRLDLLKGAKLPLRGLGVENGELTYDGRHWDCLSGSEQLSVATAIVRQLNPQCGFVLLDKLEQMDLDTLHDFGDWLESEGLQAIATRVSTGGECAIVISEGTVAPRVAGGHFGEAESGAEVGSEASGGHGSGSRADQATGQVAPRVAGGAAARPTYQKGVF